eukprot:1158311-Pelagomonas_calceolata.AAC.19
MAIWLSALPLTGDAVEAVVQHDLLVRLLEARDVRLLGQVRSPVRLDPLVAGNGSIFAVLFWHVSLFVPLVRVGGVVEAVMQHDQSAAARRSQQLQRECCVNVCVGASVNHCCECSDGASAGGKAGQRLTRGQRAPAQGGGSGGGGAWPGNTPHRRRGGPAPGCAAAQLASVSAPRNSAGGCAEVGQMALAQPTPSALALRIKTCQALRK